LTIPSFKGQQFKPGILTLNKKPLFGCQRTS
jgi:hypothetical protein